MIGPLTRIRNRRAVAELVADDEFMASLVDARAEHDADVEHLGELDDDQLRYLANLDEVSDPESDGLEEEEGHG